MGDVYTSGQLALGAAADTCKHLVGFMRSAEDAAIMGDLPATIDCLQDALSCALGVSAACDLAVLLGCDPDSGWDRVRDSLKLACSVPAAVRRESSDA